MTTFEYFSSPHQGPFPTLGSYSLKATARFLGGLEIKVSFRIDHRLLGVRSRGIHIDWEFHQSDRSVYRSFLLPHA